MDRAAYSACIGDGLRGKKMGKEERKLEFCVVSKLCSRKAGSREEAVRICSQPKPPKPEKTRKRSGKGSAPALSEGNQCLINTAARMTSGELSRDTNPYDVCVELLEG